MSDVTVLGLDPTTVLLEDIQMDVPHGRTVTIPADRAIRSRDLYLAISQRRLFKLGAESNLLVRHQAPHPEVEELREKVRLLEEENRALKARIVQQGAEQVKLDTILTLLQERPQVVQVRVDQPAETVGPEPAEFNVVEVQPPRYIPSDVPSVDAGSRITTQQKSTDSEVSAAAASLRRLREQGGS